MKNCQEITQDIDRATFKKLSLRDRLAIRFHAFICKPCKNYLKDSKIIDRLLRKKYRHIKEHSFSEEEKQAMKESIANR